MRSWVNDPGLTIWVGSDSAVAEERTTASMGWRWNIFKSKRRGDWEKATNEHLERMDATLKAIWDKSNQDASRWTEGLSKLLRVTAQSARMVEDIAEDLEEGAQASRQREDQWENWYQNVIDRTLALIDDLDVALSSTDDLDDPWRTVHADWLQQQIDLMKTMGVEEVQALDQLFDPRIHEALETVSGDGQVAPWTVVKVLRRGFTHEGVIWRKAQVITVRDDDRSLVTMMADNQDHNTYRGDDEDA